MKVLKMLGLIFLMLGISSAVANWGNDLTRNPVFVFVVILISSFVFAIYEVWDN